MLWPGVFDVLNEDLDSNSVKDGSVVSSTRGRREKMLSIEWMGQTAASICWIVSVFVYGISSGGDWLQLSAASAWLMSNLAAVINLKVD